MNSTIALKRVRLAIHLLKPSNNSKISRSKYSSAFSQQLTNPELKSPRNFNKFLISHHRSVFSSNLAKSNDSDSKTDENTRNPIHKAALEDDDFQNILKDFSEDFGVGSDSAEVLEDIKKQLDNPETLPAKDTAAAIKEKFKEFSESDSVTIHSFEEGVQDARYNVQLPHLHPEDEEFILQDMKRGIHGVFDIDELIEVLQRENLLDIAVISVPKELHYTDFLVLTTAKSPRHSEAVAEYLIKLYKKKKSKCDPFITVEGEKATNWKVIDLGNIVLHIFMNETREYYDIESLWLFDSKYDSGGTLKHDPIFDTIKEQMSFFNSLHEVPAQDPPKEQT